jgi:hypothetical protein
VTTTRRRLLVGAALLTTGSLAGCVARGDGGTRPTDTPSSGDGTPTDGPTDDPLPDGGDGNASGTRPEGSGGPSVALARTDALPDLPVEPAVSVLEPTGTGDAPPTLRVSLTNTSDAAVTVGESRAVRFQYVTDEGGHVQLLPAEETYEVAGEDCLRLVDGVATTEEYRTEEVGPGEVIEADVRLYALPTYDGCVPVGEFRFETTYAVGESVDELDQRAEWGFAVVLD